MKNLTLKLAFNTPKTAFASLTTLGWNAYQLYGTATDSLAVIHWVLDRLA